MIKIKVTVNVYGGLNKYFKQKKGNIENIKKGEDVKELLYSKGISPDEVSVILVNGETKNINYELVAEDNLTIISSIIGG